MGAPLRQAPPGGSCGMGSGSPYSDVMPPPGISGTGSCLQSPSGLGMFDTPGTPGIPGIGSGVPGMHATPGMHGTAAVDAVSVVVCTVSALAGGTCQNIIAKAHTI